MSNANCDNEPDYHWDTFDWEWGDVCFEYIEPIPRSSYVQHFKYLEWKTKQKETNKDEILDRV